MIKRLTALARAAIRALGIAQRWTSTNAMIAADHQGRSEWQLAWVAWKRAIACAESARAVNQDAVAQYRLQLVMCEFFLKKFDEATIHLQQAATSGQVLQTPEYTLLRGRLLRRTSITQALDLLRDGIKMAPNDAPMLYEFCSVALDGPAPAEALSVVDHLVSLSPTDRSFRLLAVDLAERSGQWLRAREELQTFVDLHPGNADMYKRLIGLSGVLGDIKTAKQDTIAFTKVIPGELIFWQLMLDIFDAAGYTRKARLICRFLIRKWPHSAWHKLKYAELLAAGGNLNAADRVLAALPSSSAAVESAYRRALWQVAKRAASRHEALARLKYLSALGSPDLDSEIELGYALADVEGAEAARQHFHALSIRTRFDIRVMRGLAHMAVRERVHSATLLAWKRASEIHPGDSYALREYCRSLFETGEGSTAIALCRASLDRFEADRAYNEFFVWLNSSVGAFAETLELCTRLLPRFPNPWQFLEIGAICASYVGRLDAFMTAAGTRPFYIAYAEDVMRLYTVQRIASIQKREDLLLGRILLTGDVVADHPWLNRLVRRSMDAPPSRPSKTIGGPTEPVQTRLSEQLYRGSRYERMVGGETVAAFKRLSTADIEDILHKPGRGARKIYLFSRYEQARGGTELHALDLADRLRKYAEVELWAPTMCHSFFTTNGLVRVIDTSSGDLPEPGGVIVLVGLYFDLGPYMAQIDPYRIIALYNTFEAPLAIRRIEALHETTGVPVDLLYCSEMMGNELGLPGLFEPSPTNLEMFTPNGSEAAGFVVGRHSRDVTEKHHPDDARVYQAVSDLGGRSVILGGLSMRETFGPNDRLDLLPATNKGIPNFLQALSCYYYRTGTWVEPWGRVVIEALACGLPVVAHRLGGYAEAIVQGENGFLFDETDEAIYHIGRLARDPDLRRHMGRKARATAERIVGPEAMRRLAAFYLFNPPRRAS